MFACGCASPDCAVNGCALQRRLLQKTYFVPAPQPQFGYGTFTPFPLTADDIRRIVREEIETAARGLREGSDNKRGER